MAIFRQKSLDKLSSPEQLDKLIVITSPMTWLVLIGAGLIVGATVVWSVTNKIPTTQQVQGLYVKSKDKKSDAIFYVPFANAKTVKVGMPVNVYFSSFSKDAYGHVEAKVKSIGKNVSSSKEMVKELGDPSLAQMFATQTGGAVVSVKVSFNKDSNTVSGFDWSTAKGDGVKPETNTMLTADIITNEATPISKVFPSLNL